MSERLVVVTEIGGTRFPGFFEFERGGSDRHSVAVLQRMLEFLIAVDIDFVGASFDLSIDVDAVDHHDPAVIGGFNMRVMAGGPWIVEHDLIVGRAPNGAGRA